MHPLLLPICETFTSFCSTVALYPVYTFNNLLVFLQPQNNISTAQEINIYSYICANIVFGMCTILQ